MRISCPECHAEYEVEERRVPAEGLNVRCPGCQRVFPVRPPRADPVPLPGRTPPGAPGAAVRPPPRAASSAPRAPPPLPVVAREQDATSAPAAPAPSAAPAPAPAPSARAPLAYGDVDLGGELGDAGEPFPFDDASAGAQEAGSGAERAVGGPDAPTDAPPAPQASAGEDPFAPAATGGGDELEALFDTVPEAGDGAVDPPAADAAAGGMAPADAAPSPGASVAYRIRRPSGKVFGPFADAEVVAMLVKGELLGNEEVSTDGTTFTPIGGVAPFAQAMGRLTNTRAFAALGEPTADSSGSRPAPPRVIRSEPPSTSQGAATEAAPTESRPLAVPRRPRRRLAWYGAAAAVVAVLAVGASAGLTRHGLFFHRLLRPERGGARAGALVQEARARAAEGGFQNLRRAVEAAEQAVRDDPKDVHAKAVRLWAASLLARRHGGAAGALSVARAAVPELERRVADDPEAARAVLSASLVPGERPADAALAALQRHLAAAPGDGETLLVLGDAALARGDLAQAAALYGRLDALEPGGAAATHLLGVVAARKGDAAGAQRLLEAALRADPRHVASALELADLAFAAGDGVSAAAYAQRVLAPEAQAQVGPAERARAHVIVGRVLARSVRDDPERDLADAEKELESAARDAPEAPEPRLALAAFELDRYAPEKALAALAPLLPGAARDPRVAVLQARALAGRGQVAEGLAAVDVALQGAPGHAQLLLVKGELSHRAGRTADAERAWADASARDPAGWQPHLATARARLARGDVEGAQAALKLAAERGPGQAAVASTAGDLLLAKKDVGGAEASYQRAAELDPAGAEPHLGLARAAQARGDRARALGELRRAVALTPRMAAAQAAYGEALLAARDLDGARTALRAAVALDARDGIARARLGVAELQAGDTEAALTHLLAAAELDPRSPEVRAWYGRALLARGDLPRAIEQLRTAATLDHDDAGLLVELGRAQERAGNLAEAVESYKAAQARSPQRLEPYEALAAAYTALDRHGEALAQLARAVALAPREARLRIALADAQVRLGRYEEAVAGYKRVLQADPRQGGALSYKIARAEHERAGMREALPWYERAAREDAANPLPHWYLGFGYKERAQNAKAVEEFRAYLRRRPDAEDRRDIEREIEDLGGEPGPRR